MVTFGVTNIQGQVVKSFSTEQSAFNFQVQSRKAVGTGSRSLIKIVRVPTPTPVPLGGGFQLTTIDRGGGITPQTLSVVKTFGTRAEAEFFARTERIEFATRDTPVGVRPTPTAQQQAQKTFIQGREITGPAPRGRRTTRTLTEQIRIRAKSRELALKSQAKRRELTQKEFVELRTLTQLREGTTLSIFKKVPFRSITDIKKEKKEFEVKTAREIRKAQLRAAGKELIFKPSEKFFQVVSGIAPTRKPKLPTETELTRELTAQKSFVTFIAPKKKDVGERKIEIGVFKPIVIPVKPKTPKPKKEAVTRLEKFEQRIELFKEREQRRAERFERAEKFVSNVFPVLKGDEIKVKDISIKGIFRKVPVIPFAFVDFLGGVVEKIEITGKGLFVSKARPFVVKESKRTFVSIPKESVKVVKELFTTETGLATLPFILLGARVKLPRVTKGAKARGVLQQIAKEKPPTIRGDPIIKFQPSRIDFVTTEIIKTPRLRIERQTGIVSPKVITTKLRVIQPKVIGAVARGKGISSVTIGGKQFTTVSKVSRKGTEFSIRSETNVATGKTTTKVFRLNAITNELKLLKTIKSTEKPIITFTEPITRGFRKSFLDSPGALIEFIRRAQTTTGISLVRKGFVPTGRGIILSQEFLGAKIIRQKVIARSQIEIDLVTGKAKLIPKSREIIKERIKFVDFPVKQKPQIFEVGPEGRLTIKPSAILTTQFARLKAPFEITFLKKGTIEKPIKVKVTPKEFAEELVKRGRLGEVTEIKLPLFEGKKVLGVARIPKINGKKPEIFLEKRLKPREKGVTLQHEILHVLNPKLKESQIIALEKQVKGFKIEKTIIIKKPSIPKEVKTNKKK